MNTDNLIVVKSRTFALRIVRLYKWLREEKQEYILSKQILRSGTSIGANIHEGIMGQSKSDFIMKFQIALKEASETGYWLELLHDSEFIDDKGFQDINKDMKEILGLLVSIIKTTKLNLSKEELRKLERQKGV